MIDLSNIKQQQKFQYTSCCQKESSIKNNSFTIFDDKIKRKSSYSTADDTYEECRINEDDDDIFIFRKMKRPPEELKNNFDNRKRKIEESKHSITFNEEISSIINEKGGEWKHQRCNSPDKKLAMTFLIFHPLFISYRCELKHKFSLSLNQLR